MQLQLSSKVIRFHKNMFCDFFIASTACFSPALNFLVCDIVGQTSKIFTFEILQVNVSKNYSSFCKVKTNNTYRYFHELLHLLCTSMTIKWSPERNYYRRQKREMNKLAAVCSRTKATFV